MKKILLFLIVANILIRLPHLCMPLLEGSATRQIYSAMVAEHFFKESMDIRYPAIPINGNKPFYQALEIQLTPYMAALMYKILGGVYTEVFRLISILFTVLALYLLYRLLKEMFDAKKALVAVFVFGLSPISIYLGRSANFEMPIIFFNIATIYFFYKWVKSEKFIFAVAANIAFIMAVSLKLPNLYLLLPMAVMAYSKWKWKFCLKNWLVPISMTIIFAWQAWENYLRVVAPHINWVHFSLGYNLESIKLCFASLDFYKKVYADALNYVLTPLGLVFFIVGVFLKKENDNEKILWVWLLGAVSFYLVMPEGLWAHGYYHMHYFPIAAFFIAKGFLATVEGNAGRFRFKSKGTIIISFALVFAVLSARFSLPFYRIPDNKCYVLQAAEYVKEKTSPDELIISCVDSPSTLMYYANRRGWPLDFSERGEAGIDMLEDLRKEGADYFVCAYKDDLKQNVVFLKYIKENYKTVFENDFCLIVDLRKK